MMILPPVKQAIRVIRDPVHGNISIYDSSEERILNSHEFQRLRFIQQLSHCSFVYPGAMHNRFIHSIGAMHLAGEMYQFLTINSNLDFDPDIFTAVRLAAMLHDIGHGPFSHTFEHGVEFFNKKIKKPSLSFIHEDMGHRIVKELLYEKIDSNIRDLVIKLLEGSNLGDDQWYLAQIISSEVDADRSDFLLRDSYYAGVSYGNYELPRLLETMVVADQPDGKKIIAFKHKGLMALESFIFARYNMYRGVYFHHTNLASDAMISRALYELIRRDLYPRNAITDPKEFVKWNDSRIYGILNEIAYSPTNNFPDDPIFTTITGLLFRHIWKRLKVTITAFPIEKLHLLVEKFSSNHDVEPDLIVEERDIKRVPYTHIPYHIEGDKPTTIFIQNSQNELVELTDVMKIQVPADFVYNRQIVVHPDYVHELTDFIKANA